MYQKLVKTFIDEFKELCKIPHASDLFLKEATFEKGKLWKMSCYLRDKIEKITGKNVFQDKYGNLVFDVEANDPKYKDYPTLAIQAHMDMVFTYDKTKFGHFVDPDTTPIDFVIETVNGREIIHTRDYKTSLGADNGAGMAQILTIIQSPEIKHGKLRCIITNCEENACQGAGLLVTETYKDILKDIKYMVNVDGETIGELFVASAGAVGAHYNKENIDGIKPQNKYAYRIDVSGFKGGHSGGTIHERHVNALKFVNDYLKMLGDVELFSLATPGCIAYNVIPNSANAEFTSNKTLEEAKTLLNKCIEAYKKAGKLSDLDHRSCTTIYDENEINNAKYNVESIKLPDFVLSNNESKLIINLQDNLLFGITKWPTDQEMEKMIGDQTSGSIAPFSLKLVNSKFNYATSTYFRSNVDKDIDETYELNKKYAKEAKTSFLCDAKFYGWQLDKNDSLREMCKKGWISSGVPENKIAFIRCHMGLETSWWHYAMPKDSACVSYGPQINNAHEYIETMFLDTIQQCLQTTIYIMQHANELK